MVRHPPDILITTPESLYLMLTSQAREIFEGAEQVIVDEIHAVAQTKRGAHLAITLERLAEQAGGDLQRIGLSRHAEPARGGRPLPRRPEADVHDRRHRHAQAARPEDPRAGREHGRARADATSTSTRSPAARRRASRSGRRSTRSCSRRSASTARRSSSSTTGAPPSGSRCGSTSSPSSRIARAHHGSLAREERLVVEEQLKAGELPCLVATSSLELGIDMGAVDLVLQVESPKSVTAGLQRIGRSGHGVGDTAKGRIFPKFRADLLECAVVARRMREGLIETTVVPRNPLDVLAQQIVAMAASSEDPLPVDAARTRWSRARTRSPSCRARSSRTCSTCSTAATRRRSSASCAPRIVWDRVAGTIRARKGARALAITNAGTIPDRGLFSRQPPRRPPRRRARRGDGLRGAPRPGLPARRVELADRGDHARPRRRHARAGRAGRRPVLEGRRRRPPEGAGRGDRRVQPLGGRAGRRDARRRLRPRPARGAEPARLPARAAGRHARRAERPRDRRRALPRRDRRLAPVRALALRRPRPRRLGPRAVRPDPRASTASSPTRSGPTTGSSSTCPTPTSRRAPSSSCSTRTSWRTSSSASWAAARCSARASARTPAARC